MTEPSTVNCKEASRRHQGRTPQNIAKMCLRGQTLAKRYGGKSRVPVKEAATVIFAKKNLKSWDIPVSELDRIFTP